MISDTDYIEHYFVVGGHALTLRFRKKQNRDAMLLPNFYPFRTDSPSSPTLFTLTIDDATTPVAKEQRKRIKSFDTGNGQVVVDHLSNGGYQFIVKDLRNRECALLISDKQFAHCQCALKGGRVSRRFGLDTVLMFAYSFASSFHQTLLVHASTVRHRGVGYPFIASSGTGKSTQVSMWLRYIPDCDLLNDDNPIIRIEQERAYIYGSPWSGKTPCYRNQKAPVGAVTRIDRAPANSIEKLSPTQAFASLLPACSSMIWDKDVYNNTCSTIGKLIEATNSYILHCLPDKNSAQLCNKAIAQQQAR